jgi:rubredoxin
MRKFKCSICGYIYKEGVKWEDLPEDYVCPMCNAPKSLFNLLEENTAGAENAQGKISGAETHVEDLKELTAEEFSAICSSLAKGCEKQRLGPQMEAYYKLADYYKTKAAEKRKTNDSAGKTSLLDAVKMLEEDLASGFTLANNAAKANADRGALRSLVWSEKVSAMMKSLLDRFLKEGDSMLENTKIYVCDICGFIWLDDMSSITGLSSVAGLPEVCPVCKVPKFKILQVERG